MIKRMNTIPIKTNQKEEFLDLTETIQEKIKDTEIKKGVCTVYVPHTTAGVTINENADPSVKNDILMTLKKAVPDSLPYTHAEGNSPAHVKASLMGSSVEILIEKGRLKLGTWQGVFFCEFDGPRKRQVFLRTIET
ncbi:MAG: YjbQ family protein [Candidatus Aminicenantes bacterium]|nr:YjbQ family protein [Candidatus Aminicenantes bacterium]